ncbi:MAG: YdcF family protein [Caldimonas sp.]
MNSFFVLLGIESWKPIFAALLLPPVPLLVLVLIGARLMLPRRGLGWFVIVLGVVLLWLTSCQGAAQFASRLFLHPPAALSFDRIKELKAEVQARHPIAIVVLGGGMEPYAPEYGVGNLRHGSLERLRYGLWLGRETGAPVAFSGGIGHAQTDAMPEAQIAARIAAQDFGRPLKWVEDSSRDTRENALRSLALLGPAGIDHIVLVTHEWHMPRALRAFREAAGSTVQIEAAPMGLARGGEVAALLWMPSSAGYTEMRDVLHELLGLAAGS